MAVEYTEVRTNNLFQNGRVTVFDNGEMLLLRDPVEVVGTTKDVWHTVTNTDRLDVLAWQYYRDYVADAAKYWWLIADANEVFNPQDLTAYIGKEILIPNITTALLTV
jgi:hypothetical protein